MARVPLALRPSFIVRSNAIRKGILGPSTLWKVVAVFVLGRGTLQRLFGRTPERLGVRSIRPGHVITVAAVAPLTRRQAKRAGISKAGLAAAARAELEAAQRAS
ncbi:MAG TPA: hypothetical protein VLN74_14270 [Ilumatobacteraceae bacterium]|nr:hypothetical protein [Ilumatobacteraceae bacterium]